MFGAFRARHTISGRKLKAGDLEPVRRIKEFTGAGQRREWPAKAKGADRGGELPSVQVRRNLLSFTMGAALVSRCM